MAGLLDQQIARHAKVDAFLALLPPAGGGFYGREGVVFIGFCLFGSNGFLFPKHRAYLEVPCVNLLNLPCVMIGVYTLSIFFGDNFAAEHVAAGAFVVDGAFGEFHHRLGAGIA